MNTTDKKKQRRMLYLGFAITVPLVVMELGCLLNGVFHNSFFDWICLFGGDLYLLNAPLMVLLFNSQLRKDIGPAIRCKSVPHNITHVAPLNNAQ